MTEQEKIYFELVKKDRIEIADAFERPAARRAKDAITQKYSDQAHFLYELIQNADDAGATSCCFRLYEDKLVFIHTGGVKRFTISDPSTEEKDQQNGTLGDINAIAAIGFSAKSSLTENGPSIGKFGIGFKAVFQYTDTPHIYDPGVFFKIERFIVPVEIADDYPGREPDETLFVFPFNRKEKSPEKAFADIAQKLTSLVFPVLFLNHLQKISYEFSSKNGSYEKIIDKELTFDTTIAQNISFVKKDDEKTVIEKLWLFSRVHEKHIYCVGFFLDTEGALLPNKNNRPAFCFFPTKELTGLQFIIHAPFLLNNSRESIMAGEPHNENMISLLAELAADSLGYLKQIGQENKKSLINDNIFDIIPYDESKFNDIDDMDNVSFKPFYDDIRNKFANDELLPGKNGYVKRENAYWASELGIIELFDSTLDSLTGNPNAQWVFTSLRRDGVIENNNILCGYIDSITRNYINENDIINGLSRNNEKAAGAANPAFIETQPLEWLHRFYKWISENEKRRKLIDKKPIFLNLDNKAVAAKDEKGEAVLFLPSEVIKNLMTINPELLKNHDTKYFIESQMGIKEPSLENEIYNIILPQYTHGADIDTKPHFRTFYKYYKTLPAEKQDEFIDMIKDHPIIEYSSASDATIYGGKAGGLYLPTDELCLWFKPKPETDFVRYDDYKKIINDKNEDLLKNFFLELGVKEIPEIDNRALTSDKAENIIDGCKEFIDYIIETKHAEASELLWKMLIKIIAGCSKEGKRLKDVLYGVRKFFIGRSRNPQYDYFDSSDTIFLCNKPWILNNNGELVSANNVTVQTLSAKYDIQRIEAQELLGFLNIRDKTANDALSNLTPEQRTELETYRALFKDLSSDEQEEIKRVADRIRAKKNGTIVDVFEFDSDNAGKPLDRTVKVAKDVVSRVPTVRDTASEEDATSKEDASSSEVDDSESNDEDEYTKPSVDYSKKIENAKNKSAAELDRIAHLQELTEKAETCTEYTFGWFKTLLALEQQMDSGENLSSREIAISFAAVERESDTARTLVLKEPNGPIPSSMEDLDNIPLELHFKDQPTKKVAIEVANVKSSYTLRVKLKSGAEIDGIDLAMVSEARIKAQSPVFLLNKLLKAFTSLGFDDDYDMRANLCANIDFVFGPPGTGKTTYLANNVIIPIMHGASDKKILVLTPTNKAADVIVNQIIKNMGNDESYKDWLVRFGTCDDSAMQQNGIFREKTFDILSLPRSVTVTTIARFPYDYFMRANNKELPLNIIDWDYIVIDEASMVSLVNIVYPLYKKTPEKFIIAGDPFQIGPITKTNLWKDKNIYTMVELDSFAEPKTIPHDYHVELLTTQYRSIPDIGAVFSHFAYDGVLQHNRGTDSQKQLFTGSPFDIQSLNVIKFPVSKYESIYRPKKLKSTSNYQIYSALFTFEFVQWLSAQIVLPPQTTAVKIGIIAPYKTQADLLDRLCDSAAFPPHIDVQVGTIHGFQGDECDIILAVFNPPPVISDNQEMFLHKKNIINVSISRARDYLFVVMPDDNTENVRNLKRVKKVEALCKGQSSWSETQSKDIEKLIFGSETYLEDNSFSTSHQQVNIYRDPEIKYEIRSEDAAVDIQVHMEKR